MDNDLLNYISEYRRGHAQCAVCTPTHLCIEHQCIDCGRSHAPAESCPVDILGRR